MRIVSCLFVGSILLTGCGSPKKLTVEQARQTFLTAFRAVGSGVCNEGGKVIKEDNDADQPAQITFENCAHDGITLNGTASGRTFSGQHQELKGAFSVSGEFEGDCETHLHFYGGRTSRLPSGHFCGYTVSELTGGLSNFLAAMQ